MITRGRLDDIDDLCAIEEDVFISDFFNRRQFVYFIKVSRTAQLWVARHRNRPIGYMVVQFHPLSHWARIHSLAVAREFQGRGIGKKLIRKAMEESRKRKRKGLTLEVRAKQRKTHAFYKRLGFKDKERLVAYYKNNDDGIRMMRPDTEQVRRR